MSTPSTLKLCGGVDTKLKDNRFKVLPVFICLGAVAAVIGLYLAVDNGLNGLVLDWFTKNYMTENSFPNAQGGTTVLWEPAWGDIKQLAFFCLVALAVVVVAACLFCYYAGCRFSQRQTVSRISSMLGRYMQGQEDVTQIFPKKYAEFSAQAAQIKATVQRHEQMLREEAARKNDLITYLAHDLKTPLTSVIGYLSLLWEIPDMPKQQQNKYIGTALQKAQRLEGLINEFFDITRYNLQQIYLEKEKVDLNYLLLQLTDEFYPICQAHQNTVQLQVQGEISLYCDAEKMARVFNNLLKNAVAYSYPQTPILINAGEEEGGVKIIFQNRGKTIPEHKLQSIFEKFFRLDEARQTNTGGAGLGLAIAKEIVTLHGGSITAKSDNQQTSFCVWLPNK